MNIASHLERSARWFPDRAALIFEGTTLSYGALEARACRLARSLRSRGIERGDRVALFLPNIPAFVIAYHAILKLGAIVVSLHTRSTAAELHHTLEDCAAKLLISFDDLLDPIPKADRPALPTLCAAEADPGLEQLMSSACAGVDDISLPAQGMDSRDPAVILYTSGTTGRPRGATLSHGNLVSNVWSFVHNCAMRQDDRILLHLPLFHCFGQNALMNSALLAGATLVLQRAFRPDAVLLAIKQERITLLFGVPTMFLALLERAKVEHLRTVRYFFSAAAPLPPELERRWRERFGAVIYQGYGLTETSPFASYNHFHRHREGCIGTPIENVEMKIVDVLTGSDLPPGELGEIVIRGPNVMLGYWGQPEMTANVLRDGWFHSGDIGSVDEDGYFRIVDRLKDMIDVGGTNVYPAEVENVLYQHDAVAEAAVFGIADPLMGEQVWAHVVLRPQAEADPECLLRHCRERLAEFKVPRVLACVEELPKHPAGKILKRVLREAVSTCRPANTAADLAVVYAATDSSRRQAFLLEHLRGELAAKLDLPPDAIEADEPLADLGLESLMAVDLAARLRSRFGLAPSVPLPLAGATLCSLKESLEAALQAHPPGEAP
jgi:long-chain acyl-CoA synthetase